MRSLLLAGALALVGCNSTMQQAHRPSASDDPSSHCYQALESDSRFDTLRPMIGSPSRATGLSVEMLANTAKPTEAEKKVISIWGVARQTCAEQGRDFRARYAPPGWNQAFDAGQEATLALMARLYAGELTYGEFNRQRQEKATEIRAALTASANAAAGQRAQQEQLSAMQNLQIMQMLQAQQQANRPVMPSLIQSDVNCTSRAAGGTVFTNCR